MEFSYLLNTDKKPDLPEFDPDEAIELPLDNFLSQNVICLNGVWATRRDTITYIANVGHGVHSSSARAGKSRYAKAGQRIIWI
jgi:hypothetical protein